ncbi:hypothetical protein niasHS_016085 [Heterodera schachtii]|uniref:HOOK N-terminal domain-containing protein n=1 Tax=Heterodera schachtii TaxID=97005 RepID=A0ABD2I2E9_HETSC
MDEGQFWSCALGEWVKDCVCGTSTADPWPILDPSQWPIVPSLQLRYAELCDGVALNLVLCYMTSNDTVGLVLLHQHNNQSAKNVVERSESLSSGVSSAGGGSVNGGGGGGTVATQHQPSQAVRLRHFQHLLNGLRQFYRRNSVLVLSLPDVMSIVKFPVPEVSGNEMHKLLGLLLGAAVQSPQREHFIERIKRMRPEVQAELAEEIQRVTSGAGGPNSPVLNLDMLLAELEDGGGQSDGAVPATQQQQHQHQQQQSQHIVAMLERALRERDEFANGMMEMAQEMDNDENGGGGSSAALTTCSSSCNGDIGPAAGVKCVKQNNAIASTFDRRSPSPNSAHERHANVELAAAKAELRKLRNENDEKEDMLVDLQDELERQRVEIGRLQAERLELVKDARAAKDLRDEMECMQHKLTRLERLETEAEKMRTKLGELDFYKSRMNSLKEDNRLVQETCRVMEEQLEQCQRKLTAHLEVETKLIESQANNKSLQLDLTKTRAHVEDLLVENGRLERELKANLQRHAQLERAMQHCNAAEEARACASSPSGGDTLHDSKLKARLSNGEGASNPAEMFELRAELNAHEKLAEEKITECQHLRANLELARKEVREAEERETVLRTDIDKLEKELAEQRRTTVPMQTHQLTVDKLESTEQKSQQLEQRFTAQLDTLQREKFEAEAQLQTQKRQQRDCRAEMDALRERVACDADQWERQRKALESERNALRARLDIEEANARELHAAKCEAESAARNAAEYERQVHEREERMRKLETELAQQRQQTDAEKKKSQLYREELITEQNRLSDLLGRLRSVCLMALRSGADEAADTSCCLEPTCMQDDLQLIAIIDDLLMKALTDARREADALRVQQQKQIRELDDLKRDIQNLRKTGHELNASDDQLLVENRNIKEQVILLQERLQRAQNEESTRTAELQAAKREIDELQQKAFTHSRTSAELSNAQLCLRTRQLQEDQLRAEQANLRVQLETALKSAADTQKRLDSLELIHSALASDHDRLQNLHQMLSSDYDRVKREKEILRQKIKGEKMTTEQILRAEFTRERNQLEKALDMERIERQREMRRMAELETEMANLHKELDEMNAEDNADELRRLRMSDCAQKSSINSLNVIIQQLNNALTEKDLELGNLRRQVEMLRQYNGEENRTLIKQIELLLIQNHQLHNRSDAFYAEQKELQEKLMTLRRHKEKLEEKIMEQYKQMDTRKSAERTTFMKRAAKLISKSPSRKGGKEQLQHLSLAAAAANSASASSERSEEDSSIYSTDELLTTTAATTPPASRGANALAHSPPPPPPCPPPAAACTNVANTVPVAQAANGTAPSQRNNSQYGTTGGSNHFGGGGNNNGGSMRSNAIYDQLPVQTSNNRPSRCSTSLYSSISSVYSNKQQCFGGGCSIERGTICANGVVAADHLHHHHQHHSAPHNHVLRQAPLAPLNNSLLLRARNGRFGGSLRCPPPAATVGTMQQHQLPACCKVMQKDDIVGIAEEQRENHTVLHYATVQTPKIVHRHAELPTKMPATTTMVPAQQQQFVVSRPPPPPYPGIQNSTAKMAVSSGTVAKRGSPPSSIGSNSSCRSLPPSPYLGARTNANFCQQQQQQHFPNPRDSSTPKSNSNGSSPSSITSNKPPFSSSNCLGNKIYSTQSSSNIVVANGSGGNSSTAATTATIVAEDNCNQMRGELVPRNTVAERAEKASSVYENVAATGERREAVEPAAPREANYGGNDGANDHNYEQHGPPQNGHGGERREGPKGEIWYEFGCV